MEIAVEIDTDYKGNALDMHIKASDSVVSMRRFGDWINFTVVGPVAVLSADEAEEIAQSLLAAAHLARTQPSS
jgi:hypothetical protein